LSVELRLSSLQSFSCAFQRYGLESSKFKLLV